MVDTVLRQSRGSSVDTRSFGVGAGLLAIGDAFDRASRRRVLERREREQYERQQRADERAEIRFQMEQDRQRKATRAEAAAARKLELDQEATAGWELASDWIETDRIDASINEIPVNDQLKRFGDYDKTIPARLKEAGVSDKAIAQIRSEHLRPFTNKLLNERIGEGRRRLEADRRWQHTLNKDAAAEARSSELHALKIQNHERDKTQDELNIAKTRGAIQKQEMDRAKAMADERDTLVDATLRNDGMSIAQGMLHAYDRDPNATGDMLSNNFEQFLQQAEAAALEAKGSERQAAETVLKLRKELQPEIDERLDAWNKKNRRNATRSVVRAGTSAESSLEGLTDVIGNPESTRGQIEDAASGLESAKKDILKGWVAMGIDEDAIAQRELELETQIGTQVATSRISAMYRLDPSGGQARALETIWRKREDPMLESVVETLGRDAVDEIFDQELERWNDRRKIDEEVTQAGLVEDERGQDRMVNIALRELAMNPDAKTPDMELELFRAGVAPKKVANAMQWARELRSGRRAEVNAEIEQGEMSHESTRDLKLEAFAARTGVEAAAVIQKGFQSWRDGTISDSQWQDITEAAERRQQDLTETRSDVLEQTYQQFVVPLRNRFKTGGIWSVHSRDPVIMDTMFLKVDQAKMRLDAKGGMDGNADQIKRERDRLGFSMEWGNLTGGELLEEDTGQSRASRISQGIEDGDAIWEAITESPKDQTPEDLVNTYVPPRYRPMFKFAEGHINEAYTINAINASVRTSFGSRDSQIMVDKEERQKAFHLIMRALQMRGGRVVTELEPVAPETPEAQMEDAAARPNVGGSRRAPAIGAGWPTPPRAVR